MADVRSEWEQVAEKLQGLGLKLKLHFEQAAKEGRPEDEDKVKESLRKVGDAVDQTFSALGAASRDDAVREDVKDVGRTVIDALDATFSELGDRFRSTVKSASEETPEGADAAPEDATDATAVADTVADAEPEVAPEVTDPPAPDFPESPAAPTEPPPPTD